jgi:DNA-binding Xre family transcriptional regulator
MKKNIKSTYEKVTQNKKRKENIDREYQELLISELLNAAMAKDDVSVRELAKEAGVSPTIIQELKTGKRKNITLDTFNRVLKGIGYQISFEPINRTNRRS